MNNIQAVHNNADAQPSFKLKKSIAIVAFIIGLLLLLSSIIFLIAFSNMIPSIANFFMLSGGILMLMISLALCKKKSQSDRTQNTEKRLLENSIKYPRSLPKKLRIDDVQKTPEEVLRELKPLPIKASQLFQRAYKSYKEHLEIGANTIWKPDSYICLAAKNYLNNIDESDLMLFMIENFGQRICYRVIGDEIKDALWKGKWADSKKLKKWMNYLINSPKIDPSI